MYGHNVWSRFRIVRVVIYAIITTTIFLIATAGSLAAVFSFVDSVGQFLGLRPAQTFVLPERSQLSGQTRPDGMPGQLVGDMSAVGSSERMFLLPPTLGTYANTSVVLSDNVTITPSAPPTETTSINASTSTSFVGEITADPATGVVRVTNAHHANIPPGKYTVTLKAYGPGGTVSTTFTLTVTNGATCSGVPGFSGTTDVAVGTNPRSVAIGDFNNDGKQDFAVANGNSNNVSIRLGDGLGGFSGTTNVSVGTNPMSVAVGDFNNDGNQDIAAANSSGSVFGFVSVRMGDGVGGFSGTTEVAVGSYPASVAVGDFNNDGKQDIAVANNGSANVSIRLGDGAGVFSGTSGVGVGDFPTSVVVGDFNNDGNHDIATTNSGSSTVSIRLGDGLGHLSYTTEVATGANPVSAVVGDFNNDGTQDIATTNSGSSTISIRLGDGFGGFSGTTEVAVGILPGSVAVGDFNNDGKQDIAAANTNSNTISIRFGDGLGAFSGTTDVAVGSAPGSVAIGDFNMDGKQDFAVDNSNLVSIRLGSCTGATPTNTSTNTATVTPTYTPTPTPTVPPAISGTVTYGNASVPPKYVSNVLINGVGSPNVSATTGFPGGTYSLTGFGAGAYTVTPSKTGGLNGAINSFDAAKIAQHVAGISLLTGNQLVVADASGNGSINSFDAAQIAQFVVGTGGMHTGEWSFVPAYRSYPPITADITGEDYSALLMGEVSGNWTNTGARPENCGGATVSEGDEVNVECTALTDVRASASDGIRVTAPNLVIWTDNEVVVPVIVDGAAEKGIISYEFDLRYDPSVIQPQANAVDLARTVSRGLIAVANAKEPGLLRVAVYGPIPIDGNGLLLNLRFTAVGKSGSVSPLTWERIMFNEGESGTLATDGGVEFF